MIDKEIQRKLEKYKKTVVVTKYEDLLKNILDELNIYYLRQKGFYVQDKKYFYITDFYLPKPYKIVLEVDGSSHNNKEYKDMLRDYTLLSERKIKTFRFKNEDILNRDFVIKTLKKLLKI